MSLVYIASRVTLCLLRVLLPRAGRYPDKNVSRQYRYFRVSGCLYQDTFENWICMFVVECYYYVSIVSRYFSRLRYLDTFVVKNLLYGTAT